MDVINITDGKHFGKVCDVQFLWPENKIKGIVVTGCKGFRFTRQDVFVPVRDIVKIGEDVVLVKTCDEKQPSPKPPKQDGCCPPPCPPNNCCPPPRDNRRSYDDYE